MSAACSPKVKKKTNDHTHTVQTQWSKYSKTLTDEKYGLRDLCSNWQLFYKFEIISKEII